MKAKTAGIACILALIGAWVYAHALHVPTSTLSLPVGAAGRYQVTAADIDIPSTGGELKYKTAIRIDTQTGQTWTISQVKDPNTGTITLLWAKMDEDRRSK
jgi:hypothetical protein